MSTSRERSPDTVDIEMDPASRNVRARRSATPDSAPTDHPAPVAAHVYSSSEPMEESEASLPAASRSPTPPLSSTPASSRLPSPLPPVSPPTPMAPPSPHFTGSPSTPQAPECPSLRFNVRTHGMSLRWDWMPTLLRWWRLAERLPVMPLPFAGAPSSTLTLEPAHHTMPVVIARLRTHDEQIEDLETAVQGPRQEVQQMQLQLFSLESDLSEVKDEAVTSYVRVSDTRALIDTLQQAVADLRQETADLRQEVAELRAERSPPPA